MVLHPRHLLSAAAAVPVLYFGGLIAGGVAFPGFSHLTQQPSELGALGAPHPWIYNGAMAAAGIAFVLGGLGLWRAIVILGGRPTLAAISAVCATGAGSYLIAIAIFSLPDPRHYAVAPLALSIHPLPFVIGAALWKRPDWQRARVYLLITGIVMVALLVANLGIGPNLIGAPPGLLSRVYALAAFPWLAATAAALRRRLSRLPL